MRAIRYVRLRANAAIQKIQSVDCVQVVTMFSSSTPLTCVARSGEEKSSVGRALSRPGMRRNLTISPSIRSRSLGINLQADASWSRRTHFQHVTECEHHRFVEHGSVRPAGLQYAESQLGRESPGKELSSAAGVGVDSFSTRRRRCVSAIDEFGPRWHQARETYGFQYMSDDTASGAIQNSAGQRQMASDWIAVTRAISSMSELLHPRERSLIGVFSPCRIGPNATAPPRRWAIL